MSRQIPERVQQKLINLPDSPGVYQMLDAEGKVIYVGKAVVLRNRVRSYFHQSAQHTPKTQALVEEIADITWWVTQTELEALVLENELIKRYRPHYNIRLKDDKSFPYIKVNWQDDFPKIEVVRKMQKDGARYFGPYTSGRACYQTLDALRRIFPYLDCDRVITGQDERPCLYYHIKMCGGPCIGAQSREEYRATIQQLMDFLHGDTDRVLGQLEAQMERAAENLQFELAALYRDRLKSAQQIAEQQKIISTNMEDADYVALAQDERTGDTAVQVFMVRRGRLIGRENFMLEGADVPQADVNQQGVLVGVFIQQFYDSAAFIPPLILVQAMPAEHEVLQDWLGERRGGRVQLRLPQRGPKRDLMELARANAAEYLRLQQAEWMADSHRQTQAVSELQAALQLDRPPMRIECFDVSTLHGVNTVGSMVVFARGVPLKAAYKRFKIRGRGAQGEPDDFASMREMLRRRFRRLVEADSSPDPGKKARQGDESWRIEPDLVIIDGGKGQLGVAVEVLGELGLLDRIPVVGLAKREEEVFRPGESDPIWLKRGSQALHLMQRVRDEAHRFAITYHRNLRSKAQTRSALDAVRGIGPARRKALLTYFGGDLERIRQASVEELAAVPGMNRRSAEQLKAQL
ncbi:MAG TPA: excinuclease ABC subunit UvrC [Caldilineaceae bacterium]|nr:excinuclease ABC subunit UvrC [Caldilineaceae bacterium]